LFLNPLIERLQDITKEADAYQFTLAGGLGAAS